MFIQATPIKCRGHRKDIKTPGAGEKESFSVGERWGGKWRNVNKIHCVWEGINQLLKRKAI